MRITSTIQSEALPFSEISYIKKNLFNNEDLHEVSECGLLDVVTAIQKSQKFFLEYKETSISERLSILQKIIDKVVVSRKEISEIEALDQGMPLHFVTKYSVDKVVEFFDLVKSEIENKVCSLSNHRKFYLPVGVVAIIASSNLPFRTILENIILSLVSGNTVVVKVSSLTPATALVLQNLLLSLKNQIPPDLIQVILTSQDDSKNMLVSHPSVKAVVMNAKLPNCISVFKTASGYLENQNKKLMLLSGGKNSALVLSEANQNSFDSILNSFVFGQGQLAWNSTRLFVLEKNEKEWFEKLKHVLIAQKPAENIFDNTLWWPTLNQKNQPYFYEHLKQVGVDQGKLIQTSSDLILTENKKHFLPISFTQDMSKCSVLQQQPVQGPLFIFSSVKYPFDMPKNSNIGYLGLASHLWGDQDKLEKFASQLEASLITFNKWSVEVPGPLAGLKQSTIGQSDTQIFGNFFNNVKIMT